MCCGRFIVRLCPNCFRRSPNMNAMEHAAIHLVPQHLDEVRNRKEEMIEKTKAAVRSAFA